MITFPSLPTPTPCTLKAQAAASPISPWTALVSHIRKTTMIHVPFIKPAFNIISLGQQRRADGSPCTVAVAAAPCTVAGAGVAASQAARSFLRHGTATPAALRHSSSAAGTPTIPPEQNGCAPSHALQGLARERSSCGSAGCQQVADGAANGTPGGRRRPPGSGSGKLGGCSHLGGGTAGCTTTGCCSCSTRGRRSRV